MSTLAGTLSLGSINALDHHRDLYMDVQAIERIYGGLFTNPAVREDFCYSLMIVQNRAASTWLGERGLLFLWGGQVLDPHPAGLHSRVWEAIRDDSNAVEELRKAIDGAVDQFVVTHTQKPDEQFTRGAGV